jgi:hypothetical protein
VNVSALLTRQIKVLKCGCMDNGSVARFGKNVFRQSVVVVPHTFTSGPSRKKRMNMIWKMNLMIKITLKRNMERKVNKR